MDNQKTTHCLTHTRTLRNAL